MTWLEVVLSLVIVAMWFRMRWQRTERKLLFDQLTRARALLETARGEIEEFGR